MILMEQKAVILAVTAIITYSLALAGSAIVGLPADLLVFSSGTGLIALTLIVFGFSFMFFGYTSPLITFLAGACIGGKYVAGTIDNATVAISSVSILASAFASIYIGTSLLADMAEKGNFTETVKITLIALAVAIVLAVVSDFVIL
jgi:hypothetical protein